LSAGTRNGRFLPSPNDIRLYTAWSKGKSQPPDCVPPIQTIPDILHGSYLLFGAISRFIAYALLDILVPRAPIEYQTHGSVSSIFFVKNEDFFIYFLCRFYSVFVGAITLYMDRNLPETGCINAAFVGRGLAPAVYTAPSAGRDRRSCRQAGCRKQTDEMLIVSDGHILFVWPKRIWKEKSTKEGACIPSLETPQSAEDGNTLCHAIKIQI